MDKKNSIKLKLILIMMGLVIILVVTLTSIRQMVGDDWMVSWEKNSSSEWVVASCRVVSVALETVYRTIFLYAILGFVFIVAGVIISLHFVGIITKPLVAVEDTLAHLSEGEFKRVDGFENRKDEFGIIIKNVNSVVDKLKGIVGEISQGAGNVNDSSDVLASMTGQRR